MALVVLCGHPCSGKSGLAAALVTALEARGREVAVVGEESLALERNASYVDSVSEKQARGAMKSAVERAVSRSRVVVFDSLNNIKWPRDAFLEIEHDKDDSPSAVWCTGVPLRAVVHRACLRDTVLYAALRDGCENSGEVERGARGGGFDDLAGRFETPEPRNRWDSPLFTALPEDGEGSARAVAEVVAAITDAPSTAQAQQRSAVALQPTTATSNPALSATNLLAEMDRATQEVVSALLQASGSGAVGTAGVLSLPRQMTASELRRHKRDFLRLATKNSTSRLRDAAAVQRMFGEYLQERAAAEG